MKTSTLYFKRMDLNTDVRALQKLILEYLSQFDPPRLKVIRMLTHHTGSTLKRKFLMPEQQFILDTISNGDDFTVLVRNQQLCGFVIYRKARSKQMKLKHFYLPDTVSREEILQAWYASHLKVFDNLLVPPSLSIQANRLFQEQSPVV